MLLRLTHTQEKYKLWGTKEIRNGKESVRLAKMM